jgi:hypothetical protein
VDWLVFLRTKGWQEEGLSEAAQQIESWHESNKSREQSRNEAWSDGIVSLLFKSSVEADIILASSGRT